MSYPFTISDKAISVFIDGQPRSVPASHANYLPLRDAIMDSDWDEVRLLSDVKAAVQAKTFGRVQIFDTEIQVDGRVISGRLVDRILEMVKMGSDAVEGYIRFLDNLLDNPRKMAVDEAYLFVEACDLPITPDGCLLAYRSVNGEYFDAHSRSVFAKPADLMNDEELDKYLDPVIGGKQDEVTTQVVDGITTVSMPRNMVDDERSRTCSTGLHFCSYNYLPSYGAGVGNNVRVLVVKINPADIVSIPSDYGNAKGRTCKYQVLSEIEDWSEPTITPWYTDEYEDDDLNDEFFDDDYEDDDDLDLDEDDNINDLDPIMDNNPEGPVDSIDGDYSQKLTWADVRDMRDDFESGDFTLTEIADIYQISRRQAARIRDGESWTEDNDS